MLQLSFWEIWLSDILCGMLLKPQRWIVTYETQPYVWNGKPMVLIQYSIFSPKFADAVAEIIACEVAVFIEDFLGPNRNESCFRMFDFILDQDRPADILSEDSSSVRLSMVLFKPDNRMIFLDLIGCFRSGGQRSSSRNGKLIDPV